MLLFPPGFQHKLFPLVTSANGDGEIRTLDPSVSSTAILPEE